MVAVVRRFAAWPLGWVLALAAPCLPGEPEPRRFEFRQPHMGTEFKLIFYCADVATARRASFAAFDRIAQLDAALTDYDPDSELMRLCARSGGPPVRVSDDLFRVLERAQAISDRSEGAFDVTVGPVVRLWRRARRTRQLPEPEALAEALARVGHERVRLDREARTVQLLEPRMKLDLGGIAKGFAADEAIAVLRRQGIDRALVAGSGDIVVAAPPPGKNGWTIGVGASDAADGPPSRFLSLCDAAVSTSGDAEQFVEIDGTRYAHIVDPRTGLGVVDRAGVTIVALDGATADALATAVFVLGPDRGLPLVDSIEGAAALIVRTRDGGQQTFESSRFEGLPAADPIPAPEVR